jgi:hypothetical protein
VRDQALDDNYLQAQLADFRNEINRVIWFNPPSKQQEWAKVQRLDVVCCDWASSGSA